MVLGWFGGGLVEVEVRERKTFGASPCSHTPSCFGTSVPLDFLNITTSSPPWIRKPHLRSDRNPLTTPPPIMVLSTAGRRCLRPSKLQQLSRLTPTATFTTSAPALTKSSKPAVKGLSRQAQQGQQQRLGRNAGPAIDTKPKAPFKPGERREIRQRIVLSNTNAPSVDLPELSVGDSTLEAAVGRVFAFGARDIDRLRELDGFRRSQDWKFFHRPSTVMRKESLRLGEMLAWIQQPEEHPQTKCERLIFTGPKGSGKSVLLLQTMAWALQREWVVINIPNGISRALFFLPVLLEVG
jgi:hypothetical protein